MLEIPGTSAVRRLTWVGLLVCALAAKPAYGEIDPYQIIDRVDRVLRGESSHGVASMDVVTEHWSRQLTMEIWSLGTDFSLIRVTSPAKEAGTSTLMAENDIWNYLPKVDRTIKIPSSMMGGSWMGSHFTNDDLVKESRLVDDYTIAISFDGQRDGVRVWELGLMPKPEAAVVWGHIEYRVRQNDFMPLQAAYYGEDKKLARTLFFNEFKNMGGRLVPALMTIQPEDKPGERTTVRYLKLEFDTGVTPSFFSLQNLKRRRQR